MLLPPKKTVVIVFLLAAALNMFSQQHEPALKAKKSFNNALEFYYDNETEKAVRELHKAMRFDSLFVDPYILLGDIFYDREMLSEAISYYEQAIAVDPDYSPDIYFLAGKACLENMDFSASAVYLKKCLGMEELNQGKRLQAEKMLKLALFREEAVENPVDFQPVNLGPSVNSVHDEYVNSITLDNTKMVFTLTQPDTMVKGRLTEGFMMALKEDSLWKTTGKALPDLYELGNIGAMSLTPDGRFLFFTSCGSGIGYGSCDLFVCGKEGDSWSEPQNLGNKVNTPHWESQPCFSADGQTLYFSSARPGGYGGADIWKTIFTQGRGWSEPVNAGGNINTAQEEMAPYIHPDGQTMYFSSKGHPGMGGFDLFITRLDSSGRWTEAVNLGWPINTAADEIIMLVSTDGKMAYISSDLEGGEGGYDIYSFGLPPKFAPMKVSYLEGTVYDAETNKPLPAEIQLIDLQTGKLIVRCESEPVSGRYMAALPGGKNYALNVSKPTYIFYSENVNLAVRELDRVAVRKDIYLKPIRAGHSFVLKNVFYETDMYSLSELSRVELYKLNTMLVLNPEIKIMICGHTDDVGSDEYNQTLSENRARAVYDFLVDTGIDPSRLSYKGFGKTQPVSDNDTEEGRAQNRRTEIMIL
ncbi:MAG: OmpA family protein [Bacteroidales bacterium]|nr:OmpA family protein [Bacteroidales bacterium]